MTAKDIEDKLNALESKIDSQNKQMTNAIKAIKIIKENTMAEFDFDSLLDDIEETPATPTEVETPTVTEEVENDTTDTNTTDTDFLDDLLTSDDVVVDKLDEKVDLDNLDDTDELDALLEVDTIELEEPEPTQAEVAKELYHEEVQKEILAPVLSGIDYQDETVSYIKGMLEIENRMKDLKEEMKDYKQDWKDQGVDVRAATKAVKEVQRQLKADPDVEALAEQIQDIIREDDSLYTSVAMAIETE
jgi:phage-related minor tail protein